MVILRLFSLLFFGTLVGGEVQIYQDIPLENFEEEESLPIAKSRLDKKIPLPEVLLSKNFTAPVAGSTQALVIRIPKAANYPFFLQFPKPKVLDRFVREIKVPIYSSQTNGNLNLVVETETQETKQIPITPLNFRGWKDCVIPIAKYFDQNDRVFLSSGSIRILGIYYLPKDEDTTEVLLAIDDMSASVRDKYRPLKKREQLVED